MKHVMILAAGRSKRMKSKTIKVLHEILGRPVIQYLVDLAKACGSDNTVVVVNNEGDDVRAALDGQGLSFAVQKEQIGTANAVESALSALGGGDTLILLGDTPLLKKETIEALFEKKQTQQASLVVLSVEMEDPSGYGRILRNESGVTDIREHKDCSPQELCISEINSGVFLIDTELLKSYVPKITNDNAQKEYYITDLVRLLSQDGHKVITHKIQDAEEIMGINTRSQLWLATKGIQSRINEYWMREGVTMMNPDSIFIDADVELSKDVTLLPNTILKGKCRIEEDVLIGPNCLVRECLVKRGAEIADSTVLQSTIGEDTHVGPYAYMRPGSVVGARCKVGDFVEIKNSTLGDDTKVSHLSYIGDADVGSQVNVGCGVVFVNYDGIHKFRTTVGDKAFIGCNANLISPVELGAGAYVAAGTTVTEDVAADALSIGRARQVNKENWAKGKTKVNR